MVAMVEGRQNCSCARRRVKMVETVEGTFGGFGHHHSQITWGAVCSGFLPLFSLVGPDREPVLCCVVSSLCQGASKEEKDLCWWRPC